MITNHGVHEWDVIPGVPDTGGQNVYVNSLTDALIRLGFRVTIANRGGYPHPVTGERRAGVAMHASGRARIVHLEDGLDRFVRKEDMADRIPSLADDLAARLQGGDGRVDVVLSHYWDGAALGVMWNEYLPEPVPHVWIPHSLGALKKRNVDPSTWEELRIDERIERERGLLPHLSGVVATSTAIREALRHDYGCPARYFLPPCVDSERYRPRPISECDGVWETLAAGSELTASELAKRPIIIEISRTDRTKRKDVLIRAFARVRRAVSDAALVVSLDESGGPAYERAAALIEELHLGRDVVVVGSVWDLLPCLYAVADVYCTPSAMEGFGMSAQEAAATGTPVVASDRVPFAVEYLLGPEPEDVAVDGGGRLLVGEGAIVAPADDVAAFADALVLLLTDGERRRSMGLRAREITIPYFTWEPRMREMLGDLGMTPGGA